MRKSITLFPWISIVSFILFLLSPFGLGLIHDLFLEPRIEIPGETDIGPAILGFISFMCIAIAACCILVELIVRAVLIKAPHLRSRGDLIIMFGAIKNKIKITTPWPWISMIIFICIAISPSTSELVRSYRDDGRTLLDAFAFSGERQFIAAIYNILALISIPVEFALRRKNIKRQALDENESSSD